MEKLPALMHRLSYSHDHNQFIVIANRTATGMDRIVFVGSRQDCGRLTGEMRDGEKWPE